MVRLPSNRQHPPRVNHAVNQLMAEYHYAYDNFIQSIPEYTGALQEAALYVDQEQLIPSLVTTYLRLNEDFQRPGIRVIELVAQNREDLKVLLGVVSRT